MVIFKWDGDEEWGEKNLQKIKLLAETVRAAHSANTMATRFEKKNKNRKGD